MKKINNFKSIMLLLIFILYIVSIIYILIFKNGDSFIFFKYMNQKSFQEKLSYAQLIPFSTIKDFIFNSPSYLIAIENLLGNILIFSPLGFLLPIIFSKKINNIAKIIIITFILSLTIEIIQLFTGLGFFDVDDLILNTLGGSLGYCLYKFIIKKW